MEDSDGFESLIRRIGETHFRQRFSLQIEHAADVWGRGLTRFHIENVPWLRAALYYGLRMTGLYARGYANFKNVQVVHNTVHLHALPPAFAGMRILQMTDLHIDLDESLVDAVAARVRELEYDLCVLTGDFRASTTGDYMPCVRGMQRLAECLEQPVYAVLGNHDFIEIVPMLESAGIQFLLNESVTLERGGESIYLCGVDDPHFYEADNLHLVRDAVPVHGVSILLSHSPEIYRKVAASGFDLMLSGHTHAGQICLPGRIAVISNGNCPRHMIYGSWTYKHLQGYTSSGTGACTLPVRFFCPPEIVVHELQPM